MKRGQNIHAARMKRQRRFLADHIASGVLGSAVLLLALFAFVAITTMFGGGITGSATVQAEESSQGYEVILYVLGAAIVILLLVYVFILYRREEH